MKTNYKDVLMIYIIIVVILTRVSVFLKYYNKKKEDKNEDIKENNMTEKQLERLSALGVERIYFKDMISKLQKNFKADNMTLVSRALNQSSRDWENETKVVIGSKYSEKEIALKSIIVAYEKELKRIDNEIKKITLAGSKLLNGQPLDEAFKGINLHKDEGSGSV